MNKHQRSLSFSGCRSRAEAESKLRGWLEQLNSDARRQTQTIGLTEFDADPDVIDRILEANATTFEVNIDQAIKKFRDLLHQEFGPERQERKHG